MPWFRWCAVAALAVVVSELLGGRAPASAAQERCLHGADESPEQAARRKQALAFTRLVNTSQALLSRKSGAYGSTDRLGLTQPSPSGFVLKLAADDASYSFSVVDETDPCRFGYFSNDAGVIYRGEVIR